MQRRSAPLSPANALIKLEELCARSEQCSYEAYARLAKWGVSKPMAEKIVARLKAHRFIDDERYAAAFTRDKVVNNHWGFIKIRLALRMRKIDSDIIDEAIATVDPDEYRVALIETLRAKRRTLPDELTYDDRQRLLRHASSRGFEPRLIIDLLKTPGLWA